MFYRPQFGIGGNDSRSTWLTGLLNSAPYLCCAVIGCWLTVPFNNWFGRRGTIFITCLFSALACFWQGFTNTWWHMFIARFFLGFGIGPKSATVPIYAAETTPPAIRGALVRNPFQASSTPLCMSVSIVLRHVERVTAGNTWLVPLFSWIQEGNADSDFI